MIGEANTQSISKEISHTKQDICIVAPPITTGCATDMQPEHHLNVFKVSTKMPVVSPIAQFSTMTNRNKPKGRI